jgi:hypothetical protein
MSNPREQSGGRAACPAPGRRRAASTRGNQRSRQRQPRDVCPQRRRLPDPEHEAFVDWFVVYWRRHGAQLVTHQTTEKEAHEPNV